MRLVFWHNIISPHQAPVMRDLAELGHEVVVASAETMSEDRRRLGWDIPSLGRARVIIGPDADQVLRIVAESCPESIHLIAGARASPLGRQVAVACRASARRMGIITESPDSRGLGGPLRWLKYSGERIILGRHFDFILAIGRRGECWFKRCGYSESQIFPFAYITDRPSESLSKRSSKVFRFIFVGQLIDRKGIDFLLRAFEKVPDAELAVIGEGPEKKRLQDLAWSTGISERVYWLGQMKVAQVQAQISDADVLVLPSREDGWGAVVNESLMVGTPVICSTACGASELIQHAWLGTVFKANHTASLAAAMSRWSAQGPISKQHRQRVCSWSRCIESPLVANYVEEVLFHVYDGGPRPEAPWRV